MLNQPVASGATGVTGGRIAQRCSADHSMSGAFAVLGAPIRFERNVEIYGEAESADYFYQVVTGAVRVCKVLEDGRRQIGAFHLPGDIFGLEAGLEHGFAAETVVASTIRVAKRSTIDAMVARDSELAADLWMRTARRLRAAQEHMILLGRKNAEERVAAFLLDMASRKPEGHLVELPMSRQDIADYLGLTIETVSRTLTHLESKAAIALPTSRRIVLCSPTSLQRLNA